MLKACTPAQMRAVDKAAADTAGIPGIVLMENAAIACVGELKRRFGDLRCQRIAVFCGKGNNGGDGFAIARHLYNIGADVNVYLTAGDNFSGDCLVNYNIARNMEIPIKEAEGNMKLEVRAADIVIDAVFGTGIHGSIIGAAYDIISCINENANFVMSVDIPSGVNGETGEICGTAVIADVTVTFAAYKLGMLMFPGCENCGEIVVAPISIPEMIIQEQDININIPQDEDIRHIFPPRAANSHKGDYGKVFIVAGSEGMTGAGCLAANAALYSGSGLVTVGVPWELNPIFEAKLTEPMTLPLDDDRGYLTAEAFAAIAGKMDNSDVLLFGPGIGRGKDIVRLLRKVLKYSQIPVIIDADGLYALAQDMDMLNECTCNVVLTPHTAEFSRLTGFDPAYIEENRLRVSEDFAQEYGITLLLKGHRTVVTAPDGTQYINTTGNSGMATGGSGDVLGGIIASYIARSLREDVAAAAAAYIHGRAADILAEEIGEDSVTPSKIAEYISRARQSLEKR